MKIKSMTATFGKLDHAHLELEDGLNLIYAPNEGGKSTWTAFWKAMLFGIDTRDRDKKGYLADKNHYQPWSGSPMEGELRLEHQGRDITIRRGQKGSTPFGAFSAVYSDTGAKVPGLTASNCGAVLTGASRDVFERSALISSGAMTVSATPELEKRIAALVSSGQEDVSYSQTEARLKEWLNRRRVNRSVGLIPKLEGELAEADRTLAQLSSVLTEITRLEGEKRLLEQRRQDWSGELTIHRRLAQQELNARYGQAGQELAEATRQLTQLEQEYGSMAALPSREKLKEMQGELQFLKVMDDELRSAQAALAAAEQAADAQAQPENSPFAGRTGEEATRQAQQTAHQYHQHCAKAASAKSTGTLLLVLGILLALGGAAAGVLLQPVLLAVAAVGGALAVAGLVVLLGRRKELAKAAELLAPYGVPSPEALTALAEEYRSRTEQAQQAMGQLEADRRSLLNRTAARDRRHADLLAAVRTFAPEVNNLFGCSAALSRGLNVEHELTLARERVAERRRRREDLAAQGGQDFNTLELLFPPEHSLEEVNLALNAVNSKLEQVNEALNQARGRQKAMGDPAALSARREELEAALAARQQEYDGLTVALDTLKQANASLQARFAPDLNRLAGEYLARLTGQRYCAVTLNKDLEGSAARTGDILPHSALYLSRGTMDQLYLAVRLAVCRLCLPEKPPIVLDDALSAFDDQRLELALEMLAELAGEQQILLFTCRNREGEALSGKQIHRLSL